LYCLIGLSATTLWFLSANFEKIMSKTVIDHWTKQKRNVVKLEELGKLFAARDNNDRELCIKIMTAERMWCLPMPDGTVIRIPELEPKT